MKPRKSAGEVPLLSTEGMRRALKSLEDRRDEVDPAALRSLRQAYEHYDAGLRSRWDSYEGAIKAAEGDTDRLVACLRAHKPLVGRDRDLLAAYFTTRIRRRRWPRWWENAVSQAIAADDYDLLADLVAKLRGIGQAYEHYDAGLRSRWDSYEGAIAAAEGDPNRLIGCLRARKPLADGDRVRLATYFDLRTRRRRWPCRRKDAISRAIAADDFDLLADFVAEAGRKRGRVTDGPAHRAARLARELLSLVRLARMRQSLMSAHRKRGLYWPQEQATEYARRDSVIDYAQEVEGVEFERDSVRKLLNNPGRIRP